MAQAVVVIKLLTRRVHILVFWVVGNPSRCVEGPGNTTQKCGGPNVLLGRL